MIYADNAATTKISDTAFEKMLPFLREQYGNASSQYSLGVHAKRAVEQSRRQVANAIGADISEIAFTSGGSESNSWVLQSVATLFKTKPTHIITSSIEHHSVLHTCHALEANGVTVTYLPVNTLGHVSVNDVKKAVRQDTKLVSIMFASNEIGTIQPIAEIGQYLREREILFHTDAVQAVGHVPVEISTLPIDFLSASAHKFNGAKGTGFLYMRSGLKLANLIFGGEQEHGTRAGTENIAGIVACGAALEDSIADMAESAKRLKTMTDITATGIMANIPGVHINGDTENCLPGIVNIGFDGVSGESLMHLLALKGICISTSSACNSGKNVPSHVLLALGLSSEQAKSAIRISYGRFNAKEDAKNIVTAICNAYNKIAMLRK